MLVCSATFLCVPHKRIADFKAYYPRSHWAIETMLSQPEFSNLHWTSLQPNGFLNFFLWPAVKFIKIYRRTGTQKGLSLGFILRHGETQPGAYVVNGPEETTGRDIVKPIEQRLGGEKVETVKFKDLSGIDRMAEHSSESKNVILSINYAPEPTYEGRCNAATTSKAKRTAAEVLDALLE
ncbi:uncharacterized protein EV422DRAFT_622602 [Fimicolochytrium jonesii]|uniref:uncharacterized protein n=1 Tax=Fimicolochytrium jonesii TaxID=1396493 RepID=UPI0022FE702D|nr:uncharacterized protein EV422DRAFT_622602 [Fimicolochytrium jonesii]KAI8817369.1 hypothetical protein EV422DRAFT_622602 [Fimicolochytrium jonesii]